MIVSYSSSSKKNLLRHDFILLLRLDSLFPAQARPPEGQQQRCGGACDRTARAGQPLLRRRMKYSFLKMNNFGKFWTLCARFSTISINFYTSLHCLRSSVNFRQHFIKYEPKNVKICRGKALENTKF